MLDFVQVVSDHLARGVGLDEDALHWVSVAIRESVINAIKHGNRNDSTQTRVRRVRDVAEATSPELTIRVRDQGEGFDPERVADPLDPGEPAEIERPRHLPHPQLHGRRAAAARARGRDGNQHAQARAALPPTTDPVQA